MDDNFRDKINHLVFQSAHLVMSEKCLKVAKEAERGRGEALLVYRS